MKKIVGILGMAAMLASAAFAADPAANFVLSEFDGSAEFGWTADFADSNAVKMGMYNTETTSIKFGFITEGNKGTVGDGVWGDLQIKFAADGINWEGSAAGTALPALGLPSVEVAKIHFVDGDFSAALNIKKPSLKYDPYTAFLATPVKDGDSDVFKTVGVGDDTGLLAGFGLELAMDKMFAVNFKLMDNGKDALADNKIFGMAFDAALTRFENLTAKAAVTMNFDKKYTGVQAVADYKFVLSDPLYVKPGVAFETIMEGDKDAKFSLLAGVMLGWGAVDCEPGLDYISDKTNEGVSIAFLPDLNAEKDTSAFALSIGAYDQSLFKLLGLDAETFGTLNLGAQFNLGFETAKIADKTINGAAMEIAAAAKYGVSVNIIDIALHGGLKVEDIETSNADGFKAPDPVTSFKYGAKLSTSKVIDNTDIWVAYEGEYTENKVAANNITVATKIHF